MITLTDASFTYPSGVEALRGLTLRISDDEALFVLGHNGAGKSTLLRLLNGLIKPTKGSVVVGSTDTRSARTAQLARTVGLAFQNPDTQLFRDRVYDEVQFGASHGSGDPSDADGRTSHALQLLGISKLADANPYDLPLSIRKRVAVASVVAMGTSVVVLDEPTGGQDVTGYRLLASLVTSLREDGRTVVVVTHDVDFAADLAERVVVLAEGQIHLEGEPQVVLGHPELERAGLEPSTMHQVWQGLGLNDRVGDLDHLRQWLVNDREAIE